MCSEEQDIHVTPPILTVKKSINTGHGYFGQDGLTLTSKKNGCVLLIMIPKCKLCNCIMVSELTNVKSHGKGNSHREIVACKEVKKKSCKTVAFFTTTKTYSKFDI
jgi:hypothetical protein